ncbi:2,4-diaminobutyrate 4-aminotransferase [Streptomyces eurocidicus]|uniref:Diaminobutyrate--2-oxoglutarate transaminase n=1 Tax=Streptomyces eurocidicus TaxID=66423 RepID=A0A2N8NWD9_STREU|nr:aminotransferase class III-fold pyridoxal phosphate-dependent enzyme [Streptomyces eurocidicus]MBB5122202.1 diaminobutyrate-2-oxoglutarate transaminase [Streptomyces eurocidicus]MBF6055528.1 aminotransferase class III-fold pyridoxal phosphate-dependent enzyme [Streptomyces eurocidicus]PNE33090.1 2,4-diaminobutyrate 4-aminotransferase [Streptomyces eurocidicus]
MAVTQLPPTAQSSTAHDGILRRQSAREPAARTYARSLPIVPVRARGLTIEGADGRRYLDCLQGAGSLALGHNHPVVLEAIRAVLDSGAPLHVLDLATPVKDAFTSELFATLPRELADSARIQFCGPAGTDAVETAFTLVRTATGRDGLLAFTGAHHGMAEGPMAAPGARVTWLPFPQDYRCPFGIGGEDGARLAVHWTESLLDDLGSGVRAPAGMVVEPVQGEGGVVPAPDGWLRRMRAVTAARSIPLIADEAQTGVGRTGTFWAVEHSGIVPDVMVLSRAIGGGLPLAAVVYRADLDAWRPGDHAGTCRGNQLAMAAGTATLRHVRENGLAGRAAALGERMLRRLRELAREYDCVGDVRGLGLMTGIEFVRPGGPAGQPAPEGAGDAATGPGADGGRPESDLLADGLWLAGPQPGGAGQPGSALPPQAAGRPGRAAPAGAEPYGFRASHRPEPPPAAPELAVAVQRECLRRGLIVELGGRHSCVVRLLPPLTLTDEQAEAVLDRLADAIAAVCRTGHRAATLSTPKEAGAAYPA